MKFYRLASGFPTKSGSLLPTKRGRELPTLTATNETGEFTLFATMSCMDKYDGKHEYILKMTCRYPNHYGDTSVTEIK